jgi:glycosyltransferase involved in cell wall biosynthesis
MINVLLERIFPEITKAKMHLLIVDDDSPDRTGDVVRAMALRYPCLHLLTGTRRGLGWAYVRGMKYAMEVLHADAVMEMDAELRRTHRGNPHPFSRTPGGNNQVFLKELAATGRVLCRLLGRNFRRTGS